jgi:hypothetical protein
VSASTLRDICFDSTDPRLVGRFWAEVLGYGLHGDESDPEEGDQVFIQPHEGGMRIWFNRVPEPKTVKNRLHIDFNMPSPAEMERLIGLGARPLQEIRGDDGTLGWTIMADPEGNEFCAFPPRRTD